MSPPRIPVLVKAGQLLQAAGPVQGSLKTGAGGGVSHSEGFHDQLCGDHGGQAHHYEG